MILEKQRNCNQQRKYSKSNSVFLHGCRFSPVFSGFLTTPMLQLNSQVTTLDPPKKKNRFNEQPLWTIQYNNGHQHQSLNLASRQLLTPSGAAILRKNQIVGWVVSFVMTFYRFPFPITQSALTVTALFLWQELWWAIHWAGCASKTLCSTRPSQHHGNAEWVLSCVIRTFFDSSGTSLTTLAPAGLTQTKTNEAIFSYFKILVFGSKKWGSQFLN